jgi:hypothetical protein
MGATAVGSILAGALLCNISASPKLLLSSGWEHRCPPFADVKRAMWIIITIAPASTDTISFAYTCFD